MKRTLFITSQKETFILANILLKDSISEVECINSTSISSSVEELVRNNNFDAIFVGHKVKKDIGLKDLSKHLVPLINEGKVKIYGTNNAFKGKPFAKYYNQFSPISQIIFDIYDDLDLRDSSKEKFIPFPLLSLLELEQYPFDCFLKIEEDSKVRYEKVLIEGEDINFDELYKYKDQNVENIYISKEIIEEKVIILEKALSHQTSGETLKDQEDTFNSSTQFTLDILNASGVKIPEGAIQTTGKAFTNSQDLIKSSNQKEGLKELINKDDSFYIKHITMTCLMSCFILKEIDMDQKDKRDKLCSAAYFQNIYLKDEIELMIHDNESLDHYDEEDRMRINTHALKACELLSKNPLFDKDVLQIIKEQHGDKRGISFPNVFSGTTKMSIIFQMATYFSQRFLISHQRSGKVNVKAIYKELNEKLATKDQSILSSIVKFSNEMAS